jgi:hypothetical protein
MGSLSAERARQLLGADINGHDLVAGHTDRNGLTLLTSPHRWQWRPRERRERRTVKPGSRLIATSAVLLLALGIGLLAVSYAAQYTYILHERRQHVASLIDAGALDVGMIIFALLAIGLARSGKPAKIERAAVVACAAGSALMNFAPAEASSWRSVLAWTMPPVFLAFVVDRVVRTIQRHVLGEDEGRSPWAVLGLSSYRLARFSALAVLYGLRFVIDRSGTWTGVRQAIINATPLPAAPAPAEIAGKSPGCQCPLPYCRGGPVPCTVAARCMRPEQATLGAPAASHRAPRTGGTPRAGDSAAAAVGQARTKTSRLLALVRERHGANLAAIPLDQVSRIATDLADEVSMHPASARSALLAAVRAALPAGEGDVR